MPTGSKPPIPAFISKIVVEGTTALKTWANIYYALMTGSGVTSADVIDMAHQVHTIYKNELQKWKNSQSKLESVKAVYVPSPGSEITGEYFAEAPGLGGGVPLTNQAAMVVSWAIDAYYRGGHPRSYLDTMETDYLQDTTSWTTTAIGDVQPSAATFIADVNAITTSHFTSCTLGTLSFARANAWRVTPIFFPYLGATVHPRVDTMRRRLGKEII